MTTDDFFGQFRDDWEKLAAQARVEGLFGSGYDRPLLELIDASRKTGLRELFPFTSMNRLCFARSSAWPFQDIQPGLVEFFPQGRYVVRSGGPYPADREPPVVLDTTDTAAAVAALVRLLGA